MTTRDRAARGYSVESYFGLVNAGELAPDDHVELLDGVIVAEPSQDPPHAFAIMRLDRVIRAAIGDGAAVRVQQPFIAGPFSVPEPDIAVVAGNDRDYETRHPIAALLIVEVASSSLPQDRLSKQRIYASAACPEYWIVNLRDDCIEVYRAPHVDGRRYTERRVARRGDDLVPVAFPDVRISVGDVLPSRRPE